jgi:hypothetical protein
MTIANMRDYVKEAYKGQAWKDKVDRMPDNQIIRLYYTFNERGVDSNNRKPPRPRKPRREKPKDRCEQLSFDDIY